MNLILSLLRFLVDFLIPRLITEDVALEKVRPGTGLECYEIACLMTDVRPGEMFDAIATVDSVTWLGIGVTYRAGDLRPFRGWESAL